jgi:TPR repeat protein
MLELYKQAAEMEHVRAQELYGEFAFGELEWERYLWMGRAVAQGHSANFFCDSVLRLLPSFERGELGRILHTVVPSIQRHLEAEKPTKKVFGHRGSREEMANLQRMIQLHKTMLASARQAITCWSIVGLRCGLVKDVRVMIAKMVWEEAWRWSRVKKGTI